MIGKFDEQSSDVISLLRDRDTEYKRFKRLSIAHGQIIHKIDLKLSKLRAALQIANSEHYYVYACLVNGRVKYVGMGSGERYRHCQSGISSCKELNKDFFEFGDYNMLTVKVEKGLTKERAQYLENCLIAHLIEDCKEDIYNKRVDLQGDLDSDGYHTRFWMCMSIRSAKYVGGDRPIWWGGMNDKYNPDPYLECE